MGMINLDLRPEIIAACEPKLMHIADDRYHESTLLNLRTKKRMQDEGRASFVNCSVHQSSAGIRDFFHIKAQNFAYPRKGSLLATIILFRKEPA